MKKKNLPLDRIHYLQFHYSKKFGCDLVVVDIVDKHEDYARFNHLRSTTWREVTCTECLEHLYNKKKKELAAIGEKLGKEWA